MIDKANEYDQLLECLEDLVGQMQSEKLTLKQAIQSVENLNRYYKWQYQSNPKLSLEEIND
tara:strand:+ start:646 stop:828 length:183 start_codon:yes stop_codon:yes gene_type:complete